RRRRRRIPDALLPAPARRARALHARARNAAHALHRRARGHESGLADVIEKGFTFDAAGPHIMFSKNKPVLQLMIDVLGGNVREGRRENRIWFKGRLVKYPFENDLASLPKEDNFDCIYGYIVNPRAHDTPSNLAEW